MATLQDELKNELNTPKPETKEAPKGKESVKETVEIAKADFQGLIANIQKLQQDLDAVKRGETVMELPDVKVRKARVHLYKGKIVEDVGKAWEVNDRFGEPAMRLEIFVEGKKHEVDYKAYVSGDEQQGFANKECVIKEIKVIDPGEEIQGYTDLAEVDYDNFRTVAKYRVPVKVVSPKYSYVMDIDGQDVEINAKAIN